MNLIDIIERTPRDKLLHFSACVILGLAVKIAGQLAGLTDRMLLASAIFIAVAFAQLIAEFVIQSFQPNRNARDWNDFLAGAAGGGVAAILAL